MKLAASVNMLLVVFQALVGIIFTYLTIRSIVIGPQSFISIGELFPSGNEASGLAAQLSASRLLYAMGRDWVLPKRFFGYLHPKYNSPVNNIVLIGVLSLSAIFLSLEAATSLINVGAFTAFSFVNLCVIMNFFRHKGAKSLRFVTGNLIFPLIGLAFVVYLWCGPTLISFPSSQG